MNLNYNKRLFEGGGARAWVHNARFKWFENASRRYLGQHQKALKAIELGCFDGRLISYFPREPDEYWGFDANVEGGLSSAQARFHGHPKWRFQKAVEPSDLEDLPDKYFNCAASLETLEHIPPQILPGYLSQLARVTQGYLFVTVPNEKGIIFLTKYLGKKIALGGTQPYRIKEIMFATAGQMNRVKRNEHKGFDYSTLIRALNSEFDVLQVTGLPIGSMPAWLSVTIAIVARSKGWRPSGVSNASNG